MSNPRLSYVCRSSFLGPEQTSITIYICPRLVLNVKLAAMTACLKRTSEFRVIMVSSTFSTFISCGMIYITILGFLSFGALTCRWFPHLSLIEKPSKWTSFQVPVSMRILPSLSDLKELTLTFIEVGLKFVYTTVLKASVVRLFWIWQEAYTVYLILKESLRSKSIGTADRWQMAVWAAYVSFHCTDRRCCCMHRYVCENAIPELLYSFIQIDPTFFNIEGL